MCMQGLDDYLAALKSSSIQVIMPKGVPTITAAKKLFSQNVKMPLLKSLVQNLNERFLENDVFSAFSNIFNGKQLQLGFTDDYRILCTRDGNSLCAFSKKLLSETMTVRSEHSSQTSCKQLIHN